MKCECMDCLSKVLWNPNAGQYFKEHGKVYRKNLILLSILMDNFVTKVLEVLSFGGHVVGLYVKRM